MQPFQVPEVVVLRLPLYLRALTQLRDDGIDVVKRIVTAGESNIRFTDGTFKLSASTPVSVTGTAQVQTTLPLVTKYHRSKYLIKAL